MTAQDYRLAGFEVSNQIDPAAITRAEGDIMSAYILPIYPRATLAMDVVRAAVMPLVVILLTQRKTFATRSAGRQKAQLEGVESCALLELARVCALRLDAVRELDGATDAEVRDICGIYFKTQYFYN